MNAPQELIMVLIGKGGSLNLSVRIPHILSLDFLKSLFCRPKYNISLLLMLSQKLSKKSGLVLKLMFIFSSFLILNLAFDEMFKVIKLIQ